jgi:hypothetical protein
MCFSATASFTAAAVVGSVGVLTLSQTRSVREIPLAGIPLFFGVQQAIEGALWLALPHADDAMLAVTLANCFAIVALVVWPLYAPTAAALVEDDTPRRKLIWCLVPLGAAFAAYSGLDIAAHPYHAVMAPRSLCYINNSPYPLYAMAIYVPAVCGGFLLSTHRALRAFGIVVTAGLAVSLGFYFADVVSVWCFFAAAASVTLLIHFRSRKIFAGASVGI